MELARAGHRQEELQGWMRSSFPAHPASKEELDELSELAADFSPPQLSQRCQHESNPPLPIPIPGGGRGKVKGKLAVPVSSFFPAGIKSCC